MANDTLDGTPTLYYDADPTHQDPAARVYLVKDPIIIPSSYYAPEGPIESAPPAASGSAGEALFTLVNDQPANQNFLTRFLGGLGHIYSDTRWGSLLLVGGFLGLLFLGIWKGTHTASSTVQSQSPAKVTSPQAAVAARAAVAQDLAQTATALTRMGYDPTQLRTMSNMILMTRGTDIAAAARQHSDSSILASNSKGNGLFVTGSNAPTHYQSLAAIDVNAYLDSISKKPTRADILANSAAVHGVTLQN
jgi:hypothetical protein